MNAVVRSLRPLNNAYNMDARTSGFGDSRRITVSLVESEKKAHNGGVSF